MAEHLKPQTSNLKAESSVLSPQCSVLNLVLAGPMGSGKSTVARRLATRLDWPLLDMDVELERRLSRPIAQVFAEDGEAIFRQAEAALCRELATPGGLVVACGGGAVVDQANRAALSAGGILIALTATPAALFARLNAAGEVQARPLLRGPDPEGALAALLTARASAYAAVPYHLDTTGLTPDEVAAAALSLYNQAVEQRMSVGAESPSLRAAGRGDRGEGRATYPDPHQRATMMNTTIHVHSPDGPYPIYVERGALNRLGHYCRAAGLTGNALVLTDTTVGPLYGEQAIAALQAADYPATLATMPAGETHKTLATVGDLIGAALAAGLDRRGFVVALGGGVVGDTGGLVAALYMRGVAFVQAPTSVVAMADSSIGGKVGVDHPAAKNLIGAFKQPRLVVADLDTLATLPPDEIANGMAEILKAGLIAGGDLLARLEAPELAPVAAVLHPAIEVKRRIVEADPYEQGDRALLNLGHTFGHAFEQVSGYRRKHGFGVAAGTVVAAHLAARLGLADGALPGRVETLFARYALPTRWGGPDLPPGTTPAHIIAAMAGDKKRVAGRLRFILPYAPGDVRVVSDVPEADVRAALEETE